MKKVQFLPIIFLTVFLVGCNSTVQKKENTASESNNQPTEVKQQVTFPELVPSVFRIDTYENNRILETGIGFFVSRDLAVTRLSFFTSANRAAIEPFDEEKTYNVTGFVAFDRANDLILLKIEGLSKKSVILSDSILHEKDKTVYFNKPQGNTVPLHEGEVAKYGTILGSKLYQITNQLRSKSTGSPVFNAKMECIGLAFMKVADYETQTFATPSVFISELIQKAGNVQPLSALNQPVVNPGKPLNTKVKGLVIETDMGDITIKLYDSTPQYRDNFVKLVREGYYDDLLVHRVIKDFCIQSGAADTRLAEPDDVVGWKGPGYSLPAHIVPGLYHKRGVVGSPRKPDTDNSRKRSDGSQFYIVTGRIYTDAELDDFEKESGHKYTEEQRNVYKTIGGAPHLDGSYTIFGEVLKGMDVADRISLVEVKSDMRPKKDIRVKKIRILE